jgi:hypothetical protein
VNEEVDETEATSFPTLNLRTEDGNVGIIELLNIRLYAFRSVNMTTKQHLFTNNTTLKVKVNFTLEQPMKAQGEIQV